MSGPQAVARTAGSRCRAHARRRGALPGVGEQDQPHRDRELRAYGSDGSYVARSTDVQAQAVFAGRRPVDEGDSWGYDAPEHWGALNTAAGSVPVPSEQGAYQEFYRQFAAALRGDCEFPVPAEQAVHTLEVLDARGQRRREPRGRPVAGVDGHERCGLTPGWRRSIGAEPQRCSAAPFMILSTALRGPCTPGRPGRRRRPAPPRRRPGSPRRARSRTCRRCTPRSVGFHDQSHPHRHFTRLVGTTRRFARPSSRAHPGAGGGAAVVPRTMRWGGMTSSRVVTVVPSSRATARATAWAVSCSVSWATVVRATWERRARRSSSNPTTDMSPGAERPARCRTFRHRWRSGR